MSSSVQPLASHVMVAHPESGFTGCLLGHLSSHVKDLGLTYLSGSRCHRPKLWGSWALCTHSCLSGGFPTPWFGSLWCGCFSIPELSVSAECLQTWQGKQAPYIWCEERAPDPSAYRIRAWAQWALPLTWISHSCLWALISWAVMQACPALQSCHGNHHSPSSPWLRVYHVSGVKLSTYCSS